MSGLQAGAPGEGGHKASPTQTPLERAGVALRRLRPPHVTFNFSSLHTVTFTVLMKLSNGFK